MLEPAVVVADRERPGTRSGPSAPATARLEQRICHSHTRLRSRARRPRSALVPAGDRDLVRHAAGGERDVRERRPSRPDGRSARRSRRRRSAEAEPRRAPLRASASPRASARSGAPRAAGSRPRTSRSSRPSGSRNTLVPLKKPWVGRGGRARTERSQRVHLARHGERTAARRGAPGVLVELLNCDLASACKRADRTICRANSRIM